MVHHDPTEPDHGVGGATDALARDVAALVNQELSAVWDRIRSGVQDSALAAGLLAGAAGLGALAVQASFVASLRILETRLPRPAAAFVLTGLYAGGAATAGVAGVRRLQQAQEAAVQAVQQTREDLSTRP